MIILLILLVAALVFVRARDRRRRSRIMLRGRVILRVNKLGKKKAARKHLPADYY